MWVGSKKEKKEGGKEGGRKRRRGDPFFSFLHSTPSKPLAPVTQAIVWGYIMVMKSSKCSTQGSSIIGSTDLYLCQL